MIFWLYFFQSIDHQKQKLDWKSILIVFSIKFLLLTVNIKSWLVIVSIKWLDFNLDSKKSCGKENRLMLQNFSKWNSKFWITVYKGRPQEDEVFGLPGGNYPKEMGHQSRNLFQYGKGIKHSKKFSSLKDDIHSTSSSSKPTIVTDLGMYNWWFTLFLWCQYCAVPSKFIW